jgi:uncharacterized protein YjbI with pentapeptide repeats
MPTSRKRSTTAGVEPPQLPPQLPAIEQPEALEDGAGFAQGALHDTDFAGQSADDVLFDRVECRRVSLNGAALTMAQLLDVRFDACDLAGSDWEKAHIRRVELLGCRMVGIKLLDASVEDARFHRCNGELARFWTSHLKAVRFEHCVLREASFEGSDLSGVVFRHCDLSKADLRGTKLRGADFRGSNIEGVQVGVAELQGAILDAGQLVHVASLLGIVVKDDEALD